MNTNVIQHALVDLTKQLIAFKTTKDNQEEIRRCLHFIAEYFQRFPQRMYESSGVLSLIVSNVHFDEKDRSFDLILHGHIDVVPPNEEGQFIPYEYDGKLYGRGALDMKGGVACLMYVLRKFREQYGQNKKILLMITSDEEVGGANGTEFLLKRVGFSSKFFLTAEGEKDYLLKYQQKGVVMFNMIARGKGEHAAYPWAGENALEIFFNAYKKIKKRFPSRRDPDHWYTTVNLGMLHGGIAVNSIPDIAEGQIDIRFCQPYRLSSDVVKTIRNVLKNEKSVDVEVIYETDMMETEKTNRYLDLLHTIAKDSLKLKRDLLFKNHGTNDARFASHVGIPAVGFGPIGANYHAKDEFVFVESLARFTRILERFILSF